MIAGEWMPLVFLKNNKGNFNDIRKESGLGNAAGWWNSIVSGDFDNDGDMDYVAGNLGENSFYKASAAHPVSIYAKDFDQNGVLECIPTKFIKDRIDGIEKEFPAHTRDDVVEPMPFIKKRFFTYKSFAAASFQELFTPNEISGASIYRASYFSSAFIRNNGNGHFSIEPLPSMAQYSVLNGMVADDFDGDGNLDLCINTNDYSGDPGNGRYDGLYGLVLKGNGKGAFVPLSIAQSGIYINGDGKGLAKLRAADGSYLLIATQNNGAIQVFKKKGKLPVLKQSPGDIAATLYFNDGRSRKVEFTCGSSFLSQGSGIHLLSKSVKNYTITNESGQTRIVSLPDL
jgi:hypothetical protein